MAKNRAQTLNGGAPKADGNAMRELWRRIGFLLGALVVFRVGAHIPVPGMNPEALQQMFNNNRDTILGLFNMFSGGSLERMSIFALGIMPYITASIVIQLMTAVVPTLEQLRKEGEQGRRKITQYTRYLTVVLGAIQSFGMVAGLNSQGITLLPETASTMQLASFYFVAVSTLVTGTVFLMWLGEQITERGIGNGISLIIFVGIIAEIPAAVAQFLSQGRSGAISPLVVIGIILMLAVVLTFVVFMERSLRKIHIQYPRQQRGMKVYDGSSSHLPIKVNPAGVIPAIFASALLLLPTTISTFSGGTSGPVMSTILALFGPGQPLYLLFFGGMIVFFTYFYTREVAFKTEDVADNLKNQNGFVPGIRPGKKTAEYLDYVVTRILVLGSGYLALVALLPEIIRAQLAIPFYFGGTSILIIVSVGMDTIQQIQSHLVAHQYEGLIEKSQLRSKRSANKRKGPSRR
jgi:preprotein translocase subunit SecY